MNINNIRKYAILILINLPIVLYGSTVAQAATLTAVNSVIQTDARTGNIETCFGLCTHSLDLLTSPSPNNDESGAGNDNLVQQTFVSIPFLQSAITYQATNSGGTTEYHFNDRIINNFDFSQGLWGHAIFLPTTLDNPASGLDFDFPDQNPTPAASSVFITTGLEEHSAGKLEWGFYTFRFGDAVLDYYLDLPDCGPGSGISCDLGPNSYSFTMLHQFGVPIPAAIWLFITGLMVLLGTGKIRNR